MMGQSTVRERSVRGILFLDAVFELLMMLYCYRKLMHHFTLLLFLRHR